MIVKWMPSSIYVCISLFFDRYPKSCSYFNDQHNNAINGIILVMLFCFSLHIFSSIGNENEKKKLWKFMTLFIASIKGWKWQEGARTCMDGCHWLVFFYNVNVHVPWKIWIFQLVQCIEQGGKSASMTKLVNFSLYWNWIMIGKKLGHVVDQLVD